ncbi:thiol peroxidase [Liberiplasma polymorphum]|uniref:thiol peroxidase n=1 Tax=Liberiplasma polymorphum TaxID=3374570 RepID=UPI0037715FF8
MKVTFAGQEVTLSGKGVNLGEIAPNFTVVGNDLKHVSLSDFKDDYIVLSVVASLDTGLCDYQTKTFNEKTSNYKKVKVLTISNDLPFAQKKWCANSGFPHAITLSDHKDLAFGLKYGTLMEPFRLQARAVFVLDPDRKVIFKEIVPNVSDHPAYDEVIELLDEVTK